MNLIFYLPKINVVMAVMFASLLPSWIWLFTNAIDCEFSYKLCYWKFFVKKRIVQKCKWLSFHDSKFCWEYIYDLWMSKEVLLIFWRFWMLILVNTYANVMLERSLRVNEGHIGVNESTLTIMKQIWTQMNGYFL